MIELALYQPEIPPNTGNLIRLAANCGARLHLIHPLGFSLAEPALRRAGLDYHELALVQEHADRAAFEQALGGRRLWAFSTRARQCYSQVRYAEGDVLLFGPETRGLPADWLEALGPARGLRLPMRPGSRSLNLANAAAIAVYEAWRQLGYAGAA
ncbi:MAG TPA: tRNA (cytidine(34)-2'-O)-methyltransferase [Nevskiaceae bacterium]|nr:tRNA (cytidine(34)-2'-O)-methyltransferase [Nevskiaceae bacterium]